MLYNVLHLLLILFIGKTFYDLALYHKKNGWLYGVIGILAYYVGAIVLSYILFISLNLYSLISTVAMDAMTVSVTRLILGLLISWTCYKFLFTRWGRQKPQIEMDIIDDEVIR